MSNRELTFYDGNGTSFKRNLLLEFVPDFISVGDRLFERECLLTYREISTYLQIEA